MLKKQNNPFLLLVPENVKSIVFVKLGNLFQKSTAMTFIGCLTHTTHEPNCRAQCLRSCISRLGRSWANSRRCSGIPRIDLATIRPCPRNHDNIATQLNDQYARLRFAAFPTSKSKSDTTGRAHDAISSSILGRFA